MKNKYYHNLDLIRVISCIIIFLYHLNILKGGYLAVCIFFTLSGYLSCKSLMKNDKVSLKDYYLNRLKKLYLPLFVVIMISIFIVTLFDKINWFNLKPESTSALLGYNNLWQIGANLDYFAKHIDSPFMHLWYMGILLQFDLVFPFLYMLLKKIKDNYDKTVAVLIPYTLALISFIFFYIKFNSNEVMYAYYHTLTRVYALLFGVFLAFFHEIKILVYKNKITNRIIFYLYLVTLILSFIFIDVNSKLFLVSMILSSLITLRLITFSVSDSKKKLNIFDKVMKFISSISYEVYLVQYPVIFLFQYTNLHNYIKVPLIIVITFIISYLIHLALSIDKKKLKKTLYIICLILIGIPTLIGLFKYIISRDYTKDMEALENKLNDNLDLVEKKREEYLRNQEKENESYQNDLNKILKSEEELDSFVKNLKVTGIGDSVMLGAITELYKTFPKGYFDAKVSRTDYELNELLKNLKNKGLLGDVIIINLGTNGECNSSCKSVYMKTIGNRPVFWVNATNADFKSFNTNLVNFSKKYSNVHVVDWVSRAKGHKEYLVADRVHLTGSGMKAYSKTIYDAIYDYYHEQIVKEKENIENEHNLKEKEKITLIGNDLLINLSSYLSDDLKNTDIVVNKDFTYNKVKEELNKKKVNKSLSYNIVFVFDKTVKIDYQELIKLYPDNKLYFVLLENTFSNENTIDFYQEINNNSNYLMVDKIHLTNEGNKALSKLLENKLIKK